MPDRLALPDDRPHACRGCGAEKHDFLTECQDCEAPLCNHCCVEDNTDPISRREDISLCRKCAVNRLNEKLAPLLPVCTCEDWPSWVRHGQQLTITEAA
jgi:hypothetical protein